MAVIPWLKDNCPEDYVEEEHSFDSRWAPDSMREVEIDNFVD